MFHLDVGSYDETPESQLWFISGVVRAGQTEAYFSGYSDSVWLNKLKQLIKTGAAFMFIVSSENDDNHSNGNG